VVEHALPALAKYQIPMTLYLASGYVDDGLGFWDRADKALTWSGVNEMVSTGLVTIGSHTHTHKLLDREPAHVVAAELDRSQERIAHNVGAPATHFAYPKALRPSPAADAAVRQRFASGALAGTKPNPWGATDVHLLARSPIQQSDGMRWFQHKAAGGLGLEDAIRDRVKQRAYKRAQR
jgi:peptidoglycan/xylan/chitin deacetylase (PgdA/CDA1 family)